MHFSHRRLPDCLQWPAWLPPGTHRPAKATSEKVSFVSEQEEPATVPEHGVPATVPSQYSAPAGRPGRARGHYAWRVASGRGTGWAVAAVLAGAVVGLSIIDANSSSLGGPVAFRSVIGAVPGKVAIGPPGPGAAGGIQMIAPGGGAVGGPAGLLLPGLPPAGIKQGLANGPLTTPFGQVVTGTVGSVSKSAFTVTTPGGQSVNVTEQSSTAYRKAGSPASASAVTKGAQVWVLGSQSGSSLAATEVAVG